MGQLAGALVVGVADGVGECDTRFLELFLGILGSVQQILLGLYQDFAAELAAPSDAAPVEVSDAPGRKRSQILKGSPGNASPKTSPNSKPPKKKKSKEKGERRASMFGGGKKKKAAHPKHGPHHAHDGKHEHPHGTHHGHGHASHPKATQQPPLQPLEA